MRKTFQLLRLIPVFALAACGGNSNSTSSSPSDTTGRVTPPPITLEGLPRRALAEAPDSAKSSNVAATAALIRLAQNSKTGVLCLRRLNDTRDCTNTQGKTVLTSAQETKLTGFAVAFIAAPDCPGATRNPIYAAAKYRPSGS